MEQSGPCADWRHCSQLTVKSIMFLKIQFLTHQNNNNPLWSRVVIKMLSENASTPAFNCKRVKSTDMTWANIWEHQKASWIRPSVDSRAWDDRRTCRSTYSSLDRCTTARQWSAWLFYHLHSISNTLSNRMCSTLVIRVDKQSPAITCLLGTRAASQAITAPPSAPPIGTRWPVALGCCK